MSYASYSSLGKDPKAPSPESMAEIPSITSRDHRSALIGKVEVVIIDNYTTWCGPCKSVAPLFAQMAQKYQSIYPNKVVFVKEDVDSKFGGTVPVRGVPCFHFYHRGRHIPELTITGGDIANVQTNLDKLLGNK